MKKTKKKKIEDPIKKAFKSKREEPPELPESVSNLPQINRLAQMGVDYGKVFNQETAKGMFSFYGSLTVQELQAKLNTPSITVLERTIIGAIATATGKGRDAMDAKKYIHERTFGKVENKLEHSGLGGGPIKVENENKMELVIANMTNKELEALNESLDAVESMVGKFDEKKAD